MTIGLASGVRNSRANATRDAIDAGGAAGTLRIYDGVRPATGGTATNLLASLPLSYPSAPNASGGVTTFSAITTAAATGTGTATWGRIVTSAAVFVEDFSVGTSGADFNLGSTSIASGVNVSCTSNTITEGNA